MPSMVLAAGTAIARGGATVVVVVLVVVVVSAVVVDATVVVVVSSDEEAGEEATHAPTRCRPQPAGRSPAGGGCARVATMSEIEKKFVEVNGRQMAYVEQGEGDPIVFLHGNPTSSYLWRHVMAGCQGMGRLLAPDLIGMGDSEKLDDVGPDSYRFVEHSEYLDGWFEAVGATDNVTLVIHDWGSALGFHRAARHPEQIKGICFMEAIVAPVEWEAWPEAARGIFEGFRSDAGESLILEKNLFVEGVLPASIIRDLSEEEHNEYRRPYLEGGETRRPTLTWPREIPLAGEPADVVAIVEAYGRHLLSSDVPKLFINADPGSILVGPQREFCRSWPNVTEVTVPGLHFIQEDSGPEIAAAIREWHADL
jgi:haloalkane dehalogenase